MRGQKKDDFPRMDSAGVFADAVGGETLLTLIGTRAVHIENYRSILVYTDTEIRIQCQALYSLCFGKEVKDLLL